MTDRISIPLPVSVAGETWHSPSEETKAAAQDYLRSSLENAATANERARLQNAKEVLEGLAAEEGAPDCIGKAAEMLCDRMCELQPGPNSVD